MKSILNLFLWAGALVCWPAVFSADPSHAETAAVSPEAALRQIMEGNRRFVAGAATRPHQDASRRKEVAAGQKPVAIVLTCADSRLSPEIILDQGLGDLFVLRNAGNVLNDHTLGSMEYAVEHLHATLILVLGHENCGAVKATLDGGAAPGHIGTLVESIKPAMKSAETQPGDKLDNLVRANALLVASQIQKTEPILSKEIGAGHVKVVAGRYELASGKVELLK